MVLFFTVFSYIDILVFYGVDMSMSISAFVSGALVVPCPVHWKYYQLLTGVRVVVSLFNGSSAVGEYNGIYIHD